jgi:hypothetical protein
LFSSGIAKLAVLFGQPAIEGYERALAIPLEVKSGVVEIDNPEEDIGTREIRLESGHYQLTIAQKRLTSEEEEEIGEEEIKIWFEKVDLPMLRSKLLVVDEMLDPPTPLVETANAP